MKTFILSVLALGFIWQASAITVTAYSDSPSGSPGSGCQTSLPAALVATAGFTNPFTCPLNTCCFFQNFTFGGNPTISYWFKATACTESKPGVVGSYTYNSNFNDANCTSGGSAITGTEGSCLSQSGPQWNGVAALSATCSPPGSPTPGPSPQTKKSLGAVAFLSPVALVVATLAIFL